MSLKQSSRPINNKRLKQLTWFGLIAFLTLATWLFFLSLMSLGYFGHSQSVQIFLIILCSTLIVIILYSAWYVLRGVPKTLCIWTKTSCLILVPIVCISTFLLIKNLVDQPSPAAQVITASETPVQPANALSRKISSPSLPTNVTYQAIAQSSSLTQNPFSEGKLLQLTNLSRSKEGKPELRLNEKLNASAQNKCQDMVQQDYYDHVNPQGKETWAFIDEVHYSYDTASENLGLAYASEEQLISGWVNSPGHRQNILSTDFTEVGFGSCITGNFQGQGEKLFAVQHLAKPTQ